MTNILEKKDAVFGIEGKSKRGKIQFQRKETQKNKNINKKRIIVLKN